MIAALASPGGSPGVTTSALALALAWPGRVIMAECDPSGGDVPSGLLRGHVPAQRGLLSLAVEAESPELAVDRHLVPLDRERLRLLLPGLTDPRQAPVLRTRWPALIEALRAERADVIADCGRLDSPEPLNVLLRAADVVAVVLRPTLRQVSRAVPRIAMLTDLAVRGRARLLLVDDGTHSAREVADALEVPALGVLPRDLRTAGMLSDGAGGGALANRPLIRAARAAVRAIRAVASESAAGSPDLAAAGDRR